MPRSQTRVLAIISVMSKAAYSKRLISIKLPCLLFLTKRNVLARMFWGHSMYHQKPNSGQKPPAASRLESPYAVAIGTREIRCEIGVFLLNLSSDRTRRMRRSSLRSVLLMKWGFGWRCGWRATRAWWKRLASSCSTPGGNRRRAFRAFWNDRIDLLATSSFSFSAAARDAQIWVRRNLSQGAVIAICWSFPDSSSASFTVNCLR